MRKSLFSYHQTKSNCRHTLTHNRLSSDSSASCRTKSSRSSERVSWNYTKPSRDWRRSIRITNSLPITNGKRHVSPIMPWWLLWGSKSMIWRKSSICLTPKTAPYRNSANKWLRTKNTVWACSARRSSACRPNAIKPWSTIILPWNRFKMTPRQNSMICMLPCRPRITSQRYSSPKLHLKMERSAICFRR